MSSWWLEGGGWEICVGFDSQNAIHDRPDCQMWSAHARLLSVENGSKIDRNQHQTSDNILWTGAAVHVQKWPEPRMERIFLSAHSQPKPRVYTWREVRHHEVLWSHSGLRPVVT